MFFFLICHDPLGKALAKIIQHSFGREVDELVIIDVLPSQSPETVSYFLHLEWVKKNRPKSIIVLTDIVGATPSNGLHHWLSQNLVDYKGVAGINIPMLLSAITHKDEGLESIFKRINNAGTSGLKKIEG